MIHLRKILAVACLLITTPLFAAETYQLDIAPQPLGAALRQFAQQSGLQIVFYGEVAQGINSAGVTGNLTADEALKRLLAGTDLQFEALDQDTMAISSVKSKTDEGSKKSSAAAAAGGTTTLHLAQSQNTNSQNSAAASSQAADDKSEKLTEIVVTANRRVQRALDVPAALQVFQGSDLEKQGADDFHDYLTTVPGLSLRTQGNGTSRITIRGISNLGGNDAGWGTTTTTGLYLNDVAIQGTDMPPDVALYDLSRIEVLKGPQGTLYGEGAMGGAIRMTLNAPDLQEFGVKAETSVGSTEDGGFNYNVRGAVNLPLAKDRVALRLVGTYLNEEGFVDNVTRADENHNSNEDYSIRALLGAQITDSFSAEVLALKNLRHLEDWPEVDSTEVYQISSAEDRDNEADTRLLALTLKYDFGFAELTSVTANLQLDRLFLERIPFGRFFFSPVTQDPFTYGTDLTSFSQEFRLVSQGDNRFDWIAGAFYRDKDQKTPNIGYIAQSDLAAVNANLAAAGQTPLPADGRYFESHVHQQYEQYAVYGEGNIELGRGFELTAGLRWYDETVDTEIPQTGYSYTSAFFNSFTVMPSIKESGVIPKLALSYKLSEDNLLYAQAAQGFRPGSGNANFANAGDEGAESDELWSYEIGSKNAFADGRVVLNASAFFLDWKGMQVSVPAPSNQNPDVLIPVTENAGDGEIYGFEAELAASPTEAFSFGLAMGYTHSELISSLGDFLVGAPLPATPEWTASGYGLYNIPLSIGNAFVRVDVRHAGDQNAKLVRADPTGVITYDGTPLDAYTIGNFRIGLDHNSGWGVSLFVDNLSNERAIIGRGFDGGGGIAGPERYTVARPRTYGLSLNVSF